MSGRVGLSRSIDFDKGQRTKTETSKARRSADQTLINSLHTSSLDRCCQKQKKYAFTAIPHKRHQSQIYYSNFIKLPEHLQKLKQRYKNNVCTKIYRECRELGNFTNF